MYNSPIYLYTSLGYVVELYGIFFIYIILTQSNEEIKLYRWAVLKLALSDTFFTFWLINIACPDVFLPPPAASCRGFFLYSDESCMAGIVVLIMAFTVCLASVNDCSFLRFFILSNDRAKIELFFCWKGWFLLFLVHIVLCGFIGVMTAFSMTDGKGIRAYLDSEERLSLMGLYQNRTDYPIVGTVPTTNFYYVIFGCLFLGFFGFTGVNATIAYKCWRKVYESSGAMSKKTQRMQWNFTYMLIVQISYPPMAMLMPCLWCVVMIFSAKIPETSTIMLITSLLIIIYPFISASCCLYFIGPYKKYLMRITHLESVLGRFHFPKSKASITQVSSVS